MWMFVHWSINLSSTSMKTKREFQSSTAATADADIKWHCNMFQVVSMCGPLQENKFEL